MESGNSREGDMRSEANSGKGNSPGISPYDTVASSSLRFVVEVTAWIVGPWAVANSTGSAWTAVPTAAVLIALSSIFSTPGDKKTIIVATPGPLRLAIELFTIAAAVIGAWIAWPQWAAVIVSVLALADVIAGIPRTRWLARGAPIKDR
jgi:hypothetical protein